MDEHRLDLKHAELTDRIIGVYYDVYNELGFGFLESIYEEPLNQQGLMVQRRVAVPVCVRGQNVGDCLRATDIEIGLLLNFAERPQFRRLLFENQRKKIRVHRCESVAGAAS